MPTTVELQSWRDWGGSASGSSTSSPGVTGADGSEPVPVEERVAVFDNDGTLWCEKPMPIQARLHPPPARGDGRGRPGAARAAAVEGGARAGLRWLGSRRWPSTTRATTRNVKVAGRRHPGRVRRHQRRGLRGARRRVPAQRAATRRSAAATSRRAYRPMVELLDYLAANGFTNYIVSGGGRDFMRPVTQDLYGIPRERVIGSTRGARLRERRARRHDHAQAGAGLPRRRPAEADPDLEPGRPPAAARRRQLERRHPDARLHPARRQAVPALLVLHDDARARVRLHDRRRAGARRGRPGRLDGRRASRTTGRPSSRPSDPVSLAGHGEPARRRLPLGSTSASSRSPYSVSTGGCRRLPVAGSLGTPISVPFGVQRVGILTAGNNSGRQQWVDVGVEIEVELDPAAADDQVVPAFVWRAAVLEAEPAVEGERLVEVAAREDRHGALVAHRRKPSARGRARARGRLPRRPRRFRSARCRPCRRTRTRSPRSTSSAEPDAHGRA